MPKPKPKLQTMMIFLNGTVAVFDQHGNQIPELQGNLLALWAVHAKELGYDPNGLAVETRGPALRIKADHGEWEIVNPNQPSEE